MTSRSLLCFAAIVGLASFAAGAADPGAGQSSVTYDAVIRGGTIYDGSGSPAFVGNIGVQADRIAYVGTQPVVGRKEIDASGKAVAPGFINMLSWAVESLFTDPRAQSDLRQGVTLEVFGERSMGPLTEEMAEEVARHQTTSKFPISWRSLNGYLQTLEQRGISVNIASHVSAGTVRIFVLGGRDVDPTPTQLDEMREQVKIAMEEAGAVGLTSALFYVPGSYAELPELVALAEVAARCGGIYTTHVRSEGNGLVESVAEVIEIARKAGTAAEIYHFKSTGADASANLERAIELIEQARASGVSITADMYSYEAANTGLNSIMPTWVQEGGGTAWIERLRDPGIRARVAAEMLDPSKVDASPLLKPGGADKIILRSFRTERLRPLTGKTLAEVAKMRGTSPQDTVIDLLLEDGSRIFSDFFLMQERDIRRAMALPYVSFASDAPAPSVAQPFLLSGEHPRAYGNFAKVLANYVRGEKLISLQDAVKRMTAHPASVLGLRDRGSLKDGYFADIVVFDPAKIQDHATYAVPHRYATGVSHVFVNGALALSEGEPTDARPGRIVRGRGWKGWPDGGCRHR